MMPRSRLYWRLVLSCSGVNAVAAIAVGFILSRWLHGLVSDSIPLRHWIWALVAVELVVASVAFSWVVGLLVRPVTAIRRAVEALAEGDYSHRVYVLSRDELGELATSLNQLSVAVGERVARLSQTAERQATVLGGMIEGVIAVDARQRLVFSNAAAGKLYGFRPSDVEGRSLLEVVRNHALYEAVTACLASGESRRMEVHRTGTQEQHSEIHVQPLPGEPCPGVVLVIHDTTELRRLESIRRDFVANVSHELKTPLSSIKAYTETLRGDPPPDAETTHRFLGRIEEQADRLNGLILDMLMLARVESDQQTFEIVSVDVDEVARACVEAQRPAADAKRISLVLEPNGQAGASSRARADREGLREILDNLVDNAIKYTPAGGKVTVAWKVEGRGARGEGPRAKGEDRDGGEKRNPIAEPEGQSGTRPSTLDPRPPSSPPFSALLLTVADTGIGIKPQDLERVFERFYRVDQARSRELGGTGLGLSIVKHLAQSFGGRVAVASTPGEGSTFTVELPAG
ncbi:MAG: HAMP domain-containing protein [Pirellulales bacterium]|nr:HAMP domain-containing protein [Pirellulales bacterium]